MEKIYVGIVSGDKVSIRAFEVQKETEKQIMYNNGTKLNKSKIGDKDSYGYSYGYTAKEAEEVLMEDIKSKIERYENTLKQLKRTLNYEVELIENLNRCACCSHYRLYRCNKHDATTRPGREACGGFEK